MLSIADDLIQKRTYVACDYFKSSLILRIYQQVKLKINFQQLTLIKVCVLMSLVFVLWGLYRNNFSYLSKMYNKCVKYGVFPDSL